MNFETNQGISSKHIFWHIAVVAEWLRRQTRNLLGSARAGSNPADCATVLSDPTFGHPTYKSPSEVTFAGWRDTALEGLSFLVTNMAQNAAMCYRLRDSLSTALQMNNNTANAL